MKIMIRGNKNYNNEVEIEFTPEELSENGEYIKKTYLNLLSTLDEANPRQVPNNQPSNQSSGYKKVTKKGNGELSYGRLNGATCPNCGSDKMYFNESGGYGDYFKCADCKKTLKFNEETKLKIFGGASSGGATETTKDNSYIKKPSSNGESVQKNNNDDPFGF